MLISSIIIDEILYVNLHAEQSFYGTFNADQLDISKNIITGIYAEELNLTVLEEVFEFIKINKSKINMVVLEFQKLITAQKNLYELVNKIRNENKFLVLKNINSTIVEKLLLNDCLGYFENDSKATMHKTFLLDEETVSKKKLVKEIKEIFDKEFISKLGTITIENDEKRIHHSSSVYLNKFIDVKKLIVNHKSLFFYSCYWLAVEMNNEKTNRTWNIEKGCKITLLCQNLNSSFIASILSSFLLLDVITLDHIGPINKVYNQIESKINHGEKYLVISDVVCMGTEVRIAKNIIEFSGGKYVGNICLIRIMTMELEDKYRDIESVFEITKANNPIDFKISTALN